MAVTSNLSFLGKIGTIDRGLGIYNFSAQFPLYIYYLRHVSLLRGDRRHHGSNSDAEHSRAQAPKAGKVYIVTTAW